MKLDEFITSVLVDINKGISSAQEQTDRKYFVEVSDKKGVHFDVAVTTTQATGSQAEGTAKVGFVQVLGAGVGAKLEEKNKNSQVSRIQFSVYVPPSTQAEERTFEQRLEEKGVGGVGW